MPPKDSAEKAVRDIRRKTRRKFSAEEKIRIVLEGLRGEESIASKGDCRVPKIVPIAIKPLCDRGPGKWDPSVTGSG